MDAVPSILSSASTVMQHGFARLDRAAVEIVSATTTDSPDAGLGMRDPFLLGVFDTMLARQEVRAGVVLTHAFAEMSESLRRLGEGQVDLYA